MTSWRDRIGGPNAVTLTAWGLLLPWSILMAVTFVPPPDLVDPTALALWAGLGGVGHLATGFVLWFARQAWLSASEHGPQPWRTLATFVLAGAAREATIGQAAVFSGVLDDPNLAFRLPAGSILTAAWLVAAALLVDNLRSQRTAFDALEARRGQLQVLRQDLDQALTVWCADLLNGSRRHLDQELQRIRRSVGPGPADPATAAHAADQLFVLIDTFVRPLGRRLEQDTVILPVDDIGLTPLNIEATSGRDAATGRAEGRRAWRMELRRDLDDTTRIAPFSWFAPTILMLITLLPWTLAATDHLRAGWFAAAIAAAVAIALIVAKLAAQPWLARQRLAIRLPAVILVWANIGLIAAAVASVLPGLRHASPVELFSVVAAVFMLCLAAGLSAAVRDRWELARRRLRSIRQELDHVLDTLRATARDEQHRLAQVVHGELHNRLASAAVQIERLGGDERATQPRVVVERVREACERLLTTGVTTLEPHAHLRSLADVWRPAVSVSFQLEEGMARLLQRHAMACEALFVVVRQAVANAARHGAATTVDVALATSTDRATLLITVTDDGDGTRRDFRPGTGTRMFDRHTTRWTLVEHAHGMRFEAAIPLR